MSIAAAWLLTYAVHSTLLLGGAWLATRLLVGRRLALQEALWKLALVGGLITASLQLGLGLRPVAGAWPLGFDPGNPNGAPGLMVLAAPGAPAERPLAAPRQAISAGRDPASGAPKATASRAAGRPAPGASGLLAAAGVLAALAFAGGLLRLVPLALAHLRLARRLRGRAEVATGPLPRFLRRLEPAAGLARPVRLTATPRLGTPIARGLARGEICLPERALRELAPAEQEGVVAHELAHLARRDPAWLLLARAVEGLLFLQPLNRLARRRLVEIAEYRADDWAAGHTGRPLDLARCLTEVAGWSLLGAAPLPVPGIADGATSSSALGRRVRRLVERPARAWEAVETAPRWLQPAGVAALLLVALTAPGVAGGVAGGGAATSVRLAAGGEPGSGPVVAVASDPDPDLEVHPEAAEDDEDETGEWIEDEIERGFEGVEEDLEKALEPLEAGIDTQFDAFGEEFEQRMEAVGEEFERDMESLGEEMEALAEEAEKMARLHAARGEAFDFGDFGPRLDVDFEDLVEEMVAAGESFRTFSDRHIDHRLHERIAELTAAVVPSPETLERIHAEAERLSAEARRLAAAGALSEAEKDRLRLEARAVADLARPDEAKLAELREQARKLAEQARPSPEELDALRADLEARLPEIRERQREAVARQRAALERQRAALEHQRAAAERERNEIEATPPPR